MTIGRILAFLGVLLCCGTQALYSQFYNKEVKAEILYKKDSEFYTLAASAENLTPSDYNVRYEYLVFQHKDNDSVAKAGQGDRFFIKAGERKILTTLTVNYSVEDKIIIVLLLYDKDDNPIGKDRLVLEYGGRTDLDRQITNEEKDAVSKDQAAPQDGFVLNGFVLEKTLTKAGRDFYRYFWSEYYEKQVKTSKNILIEEVPGRGRNTQINVEVEGQLVWRFFSQPRKDYLKQMASVAFARAIRYIQQLEQQKEQLIHY